MSEASQALAFGDVVLLSAADHPKGPLILCGDGLAGTEIGCAEADDQGQLEIRNCLFRLVPRLNYSAASELREKNRHWHSHARFAQADGESLPSRANSNPALGMHWEAANELKMKAELEAMENSKLMAGVSTILKYGDRLQLFHVKSDKFVTCIPEESALCNKKARRAALTDGNEGSTFVLLPMYKYQDTGDPVQDGDSMMFYPVELGSAWFLRPAEMCNPDGSCECQIFSRAAGWKTRRVWRSAESSGLHYGSVIRLLHPQQEVYLKASTKAARKDEGLFTSKFVSATPSLRKQGTKQTSGKTFWVLESLEPLDVSTGPGPLVWGSGVALRHLLTGAYLTAVEIPLGEGDGDLLAQPSLFDRPGTSESGERPCLHRMSVARRRTSRNSMRGDSREGTANRGNRMRGGSMNQPFLARSGTMTQPSLARSAPSVGFGDRSMLAGVAYEQFMNLVLEPSLDPERGRFVLEYPGAEYARSSVKKPLPNMVKVRVMLRYDAPNGAGEGQQAFYLHCSGQKFNREKEQSQSVMMNLTSWRSEADTLILLQDQENVRDAEVSVCLTGALNLMSHRYARIDQAQKNKAMRNLSLSPLSEGAAEGDTEGQSSSLVAVDEDAKEVDSLTADLLRIFPTPRSDDISQDEDEVFLREAQYMMVQKSFQHVLWTTNNFLTKTDIGQDEGLLDLADGDNLDKLLCDDLERAPSAAHQTLFREARGMDAIVAAIEELKCTLPPRQTSRAAVDLQDGFGTVDQNGAAAMATASSGCLKLLFVVFRAAYQDSRENEDYVLNRKWIEGVIIPHFAYGVYAEKAFSTLVTNNRELLDRIDAEIVFKFTKFIRELGPDQDFLEFMESICSCQGRGITRLQELCLRVLYHAGELAPQEEIKATGWRRKQLLPHFEIEGDEIFVSWHHNADLEWEVGQESLYHAPQHLGLQTRGQDQKYQRDRVFLTDLFHFSLNGRPATSSGRHDHTRHDHTPQSKMKAQCERAVDALACYFKRYLFLVAEMCISRSVNCVEFLQEEFTQPLLLAALKESRLPFDLRAAFARVMQMLYVDVPGKVLHTFPASVRALRSIHATLSKDKRSMSFHAASDSMVLQLENVILNHFKAMGGCMVVAEVSKNQFSKVLLDILLLLLRFGHFDVDDVERLKKLQEITKQIVPALDGREDLVSPESRALLAPISMVKQHPHRTISLKSGSCSRCCPCCCCCSRRKKQTSKRVAPELRGAPSFDRMDDARQQIVKDQDYQNAESEAQEDMQLLLDCKQVMIVYLRVVLDVGQEYLISKLLEVFEAMYLPNGVDDAANSSLGSSWNQMHENAVGKAMDSWRKAFWEGMGLTALASSKEKCFTAVLLHLSLYSSQQLHEAVMDLLYTSHHMVLNTVEKLGTLEVITDRPVLDQFIQIRSKVENLEYLLCSHERWLWNNEFSPRDKAKVDQIMRLLIELRLEVSAPPAVKRNSSEGSPGEAKQIPRTDSTSPNQAVQNMCSSLGVINLALSAFSIDPAGGEAKTRDKEGERLLMSIQTLCSYLLAQLCRNHPSIQAILFERLELLIEQIPKNVGIEHVINCMFERNAELCERITRNLVMSLARRIRMTGWNTSHLQALSSLLSYGHAFHHVKEMMLDIFKDDKYSKCLQIDRCLQIEDAQEGMQDMVSRRECLEHLLRAQSSTQPVNFPSPGARTAESGEAKIAYSIELLNFLATLCKYRDPSAESFVQYLCSPVTLARQFLDIEAIRTSGKDGIPSATCLQFQRGCLRLIVFAYIDVFHADIVYYDSEVNMTLLQMLVKTLMNEAKSESAAMEEYVSEGVLEYLMKYAENAFENGRSPRMVASLLGKAADALEDLWDDGRYMKFNLRAVLQSKCHNSSDDPMLKKMPTHVTNHSHHAPNGSSALTEPATLSAQYFSRPVNYGVRCLRSAVSTTMAQHRHAQQSDAHVHQAWQHFVQKLPDSACFFKEYKSECEDLICSIEGRLPGKRDEEVLTVPKGRLFTTWIQACLENSKKGWNWSATCQQLLLCLEYMWSTFELVCEESSQEYEATDDLHMQLEQFFAYGLPSDIEEMKQVQDQLADYGLAELVSRVIAAQPPQRTLLVASELATALAMGAHRSVQDKFNVVFLGDCGVPVLDLIIEKLSSRLLTIPRYRELRSTLSQRKQDCWPNEMVAQMTMVTRNTEFLIMAMCFLKQLCECHHLPNQNYMRDPNDSSVDLLAQIVNAVGRFSKHLPDIDEVELELLVTCLEMLSETMQGPCPANQAFLASTRLLESLMRICHTTLSVEQEDDGYESEIVRNISRDSKNQNQMLSHSHDKSPLYKMTRLAVRLRESVIGTMNAMIECRLPNDAHKEVYAQMQSWVDQSALDFRLAENYRVLAKSHVDCERPEFEEAQQIMILIESMRLVKPDFCQTLSPHAEKAVDKWKSALRQVEVVLPEDSVQRVTVVHFPQPRVMSYVPSTNYARMVRSVILLNDKEKAREFIEQVVDLLPHAVHSTYLSQFFLFRFFLENKSKKMVLLEQMSIVISMIIALVLIVYAKEVDSTGDSEADLVQQTLPQVDSVRLPITSWADVPGFLVYVLSWVNIVALGLLLVIHICIRAPVQFMRASEQPSRKIALRYQCLLILGVLSFAVVTILPCAVGKLGITVMLLLCFLFFSLISEYLHWVLRALSVSSYQEDLVDSLWQVGGFLWDTLAVNEVYVPFVFLLLNIYAKYNVFYYSLLPMAVVFRFESMISVVQALVVSFKTMLRLAFLACLVISVFAFHNFLEAQESMVEGECTNVRTCWLYTFYRGLTHGDGIGDYLGRDDLVEVPRVLWDVLFFIVFTVIMFNLIAAVIIDNFGALRDDQMQREDLRKNYCLLSGLSRPELDLAALRAGKPSRGFDYYSGSHGPQNTRAYMAWIFHLLLKDRSKMTGPELHCVELVEKRVTSWVPIGRAVIKEDAERIMRGEAQEDVEGRLNKLSEQLMQLPAIENRVASVAHRVEMLAAGQEELSVGVGRVTDAVDNLLRAGYEGPGGEPPRPELSRASILSVPDDGEAADEAV